GAELQTFDCIRQAALHIWIGQLEVLAPVHMLHELTAGANGEILPKERETLRPEEHEPFRFTPQVPGHHAGTVVAVRLEQRPDWPGFSHPANIHDHVCSSLTRK